MDDRDILIWDRLPEYHDQPAAELQAEQEREVNRVDFRLRYILENWHHFSQGQRWTLYYSAVRFWFLQGARRILGGYKPHE